jgi:hypothetical protein
MQEFLQQENGGLSPAAFQALGGLATGFFRQGI